MKILAALSCLMETFSAGWWSQSEFSIALAAHLFQLKARQTTLVLQTFGAGLGDRTHVAS